ncbi:MAG: hypothetical protein IPN01_07345 [Deltaproteobacteria bacterium]|nr:hypothetical protein [Deltaproteobacteria bacterium]
MSRLRGRHAQRHLGPSWRLVFGLPSLAGASRLGWRGAESALAPTVFLRGAR